MIHPQILPWSLSANPSVYAFRNDGVNCLTTLPTLCSDALVDAVSSRQQVMIKRYDGRHDEMS